LTRKFYIIIIFAFILSGCLKLKGEFAFKKIIDDKYRTVDGLLEIEKNEKINWVYVFKKIRGRHNVLVTLYKKEIVWSDISNRTENISETNNIIYGTIEKLSDGTYKIVLSEANKIIDGKEFAVFTENENKYEYSDE
jgi:hypothetical protein